MDHPASERTGRRRRRAVGPAGSAAAVSAQSLLGDRALQEDALTAGERLAGTGNEPPAPDDDARLLADVPPHHGGH